jgi:2',3'-cyclic-nucleotide 2'-phosphodiesterase (5'-nucleotidase family)
MFRTLSEARQSITSQLADNNLAAVLIQLNDTYLIDERTNVPGLPRIASFVKEVRQQVGEALGSDRTLVLHAGDFVGPSLMSMAFKGRQMIDLLHHCQVNFATIGNHEFDFGAGELEQRLNEARFRKIAANLTPVDGGGHLSIEPLAFWPEPNPFVAITAIAGEQTRLVAQENGWEGSDPQTTLGPIIRRVAAMPWIRSVIVLTHMSREEDDGLRRFISECWPQRGFVYVIAGHDHDIYWGEPNGARVVVSKCLSNAKSVNVLLMLRDNLGSLGLDLPDFEPELTPSEIAWRDRKGIDRPKRVPKRQPMVKGRCRTTHDVIRAYRRFVPTKLDSEFSAGFERRLRQWCRRFTGKARQSWIEDGEFAKSILEHTEFQSLAAVCNAIHAIPDVELFAGLRPNPEAQAAVESWRRRLAMERNLPNDEVVARLRPTDPAARLDATDISLRSRSTDFGNFVADAVKRQTGAEVVLINSGCFRYDDEIPPQVMLSHLYDVFLYDRADALVIARLSRSELVAFYEHAVSRSGHGAFLQVSETEDQIKNLPEKADLKAALIKHMLVNAEDGYVPLLARARGRTEDEIIAEARGLEGASLIETIRQGAHNDAIAYCSTERLAARQNEDDLERWAVIWRELVDEFNKACERAGIIYIERRERLTWNEPFMLKTGDPDLERQVALVHNAMIGFVNAHFPPGQYEPIQNFIERLSKARFDPHLRDIHVDYFRVITGNEFPPERGVFF